MVIALTGYRQALEELFQRTTGGSKFGLERTLAVLAALGDPHQALRAIHIAGTNGKGSVASTVSAVLRARGFRVGMYTSPHLVDFRERILIDGRPVDEEIVEAFIAQRMAMIIDTGATFFEATTAMAFEIFARASVDVAVVETGLGGRLDSTNVLTPVVAAVTSIGIDHVEYLGDTREAIALEKAGIFKPGVPAVIGEPDAAIRVLLARAAQEVGAAPVRIRADEWAIGDVRVDGEGTRFSLSQTNPGEEFQARAAVPRYAQHAARHTIQVHTPLIGAHQSANAATALMILDSAPGALHVPVTESAPHLRAVRLPGRFQQHEQYIFDVAHNRDGAAVLAATLRVVQPPGPIVALICVLGDKDWRGMMAELAPVVDRMVTTQAPTAPSSRAWNPEEAARYGKAQGWRIESIPSFDAALAHVGDSGGTALITGSFHTVGDAMSRLQVSACGG